MNTITCMCLLVCASVAYAAVVPEELAPEATGAEEKVAAAPVATADESLDGQESRWGYGGGWGGHGYGGGWGGHGYGGGWGGRGYGGGWGGHDYGGGWGDRGWGHGGGWGYGGGYGGGYGWGR